jgi:hypothetical protein
VEEMKAKEDRDRDEAERKAAADIAAATKKQTFKSQILFGIIAANTGTQAMDSDSDGEEVLPSNLVLHDRQHRATLGVIDNSAAASLAAHAEPESAPFEMIRDVKVHAQIDSETLPPCISPYFSAY